MKKEYNFRNGKRGPVLDVSKGKTRITIRIDNDILDWFRFQADKAGGGNYQTLINSALKEFMLSKKEPLEETIRNIVREELSEFKRENKS